MDFLDRLREKPESYRIRVALLTAFGITAIIFVVWAVMLFARLPDVSETAIPADETISPFATVRKGLEDVFESGRERVETLRRAFESPFETGPDSESSL